MDSIKCVGLTVLLSLACGGGTGSGEGEAPPLASFLLVQGDDAQCPSFANSETAFDVFSSALATGDADTVGIAEVRIIEECSGAGGTHFFSSRTADGKRFWLGRHSCWADLPNNSLDSGVIVGLGQQTAALFQGDEGWCMNYPGEDQVFATDLRTNAIAWFADEAEATRFLNAL